MRTVALVALSALFFAACSSSSTPSGAAADLATAPGTGGGGPSDAAAAKVPATVVVHVPSDFKGTPRQLLIAAFDKFPVAGPPVGVLYQGSPTLVAGQSIQLTADASGLNGTDFVLAVLYVQGGGQLAPMPGVDYASGPAKVTFDGKPVDVGTLTLAVVPSVDGGP